MGEKMAITIETIIYGCIFGILVGLMIYWVIMMLRFKHTVVIKELVAGRKIIFKDKARDLVIDGVSYWQLQKEKNKEKRLMSVPPAEAVEVTTKGKKWAEVYRTVTGEYIFLKDTGQIAEKPTNLYKDLPKDLEKIKDPEERYKKITEWKDNQLKTWEKDNNVISAYEPLTSKQRLILINNIRKAEARKTFSWQQNLPMIVGIGATVILVIALMIFYGEIAAPVISMHEKELSYEAMRTEQLKVLRDIQQGIQTIESNQKTGTTTAPD